MIRPNYFASDVFDDLKTIEAQSFLEIDKRDQDWSNLVTLLFQAVISVDDEEEFKDAYRNALKGLRQELTEYLRRTRSEVVFLLKQPTNVKLEKQIRKAYYNTPGDVPLERFDTVMKGVKLYPEIRAAWSKAYAAHDWLRKRLEKLRATNNLLRDARLRSIVEKATEELEKEFIQVLDGESKKQPTDDDLRPTLDYRFDEQLPLLPAWEPKQIMKSLEKDKISPKWAQLPKDFKMENESVMDAIRSAWGGYFDALLTPSWRTGQFDPNLTYPISSGKTKITVERELWGMVLTEFGRFYTGLYADVLKKRGLAANEEKWKGGPNEERGAIKGYYADYLAKYPNIIDIAAQAQVYSDLVTGQKLETPPPKAIDDVKKAQAAYLGHVDRFLAVLQQVASEFSEKKDPGQDKTKSRTAEIGKWWNL
jgi:hypothetical protein